MDFGSLAYTYPWAGPAAAQTFKVDNGGLSGPKFSLWSSGSYHPEDHSENFGAIKVGKLDFEVVSSNSTKIFAVVFWIVQSRRPQRNFWCD